MENTTASPPHLNASIGAFSPVPVTSFEREVFLTTTTDHPVKYTIRAYPNQKLDIQLEHLPLYGSIEFSADRTFSYQPDPFFDGIDTFSFLLRNGVGQIIAIPFTVSVNPAVAKEEEKVKEPKKEVRTPTSQFKTSIGKKITENIPLDEEDTYTVSLKKQSTHGTVEVFPDGTFEYTPLPSFSGKDTFQISQHFMDGDTHHIDIEVAVVKPALKKTMHSQIKNKGKARPKKGVRPQQG